MSSISDNPIYIDCRPTDESNETQDTTETDPYNENPQYFSEEHPQPLTFKDIMKHPATIVFIFCIIFLSIFYLLSYLRSLAIHLE